MGHTDKTEKHPEKQLFEQLDHVRAGMLGIEGSHSHMQPMAHMKDKAGARKTLEDLIKAYPKSEAAVAAKERLAALK